ncbi:MAG: RNA-binding PUA domain protein [Haloquadratum walsbyi J07HQW1]|jgi:PUA-domain protein|uniref:RNA-binding PUA domain protein n=1 Tax=Haloquadratum walsbyi J07HQW1 TaxID=1238424 RepID=U1N8Z6_9EURY|nr:MAG: RNA-binding PUA domain protein [Haloquadratum walsbyi J07HQW1]
MSFRTTMQVKSRHHLRADEIDTLTTAIEQTTGVALDAETYELVELDDVSYDVVLTDDNLDVVRFDDDEPFLTVQGANRYNPTQSLVTVDAGAISFVSNGADVMRPGIVDAGTAIDVDDLVLIVEETHDKILAVGRALVDGDEMIGESGKVVESIHHVGDDLYSFTV